MTKEFTAENLQRLKDLFVDLSFKGEQLDGKFGANVLNPFELLTQTTISTLRNLLKGTRKAIQEMDDLDEWSMTQHQTNKKDRLTLWAEFLFLLVGYRLDQEVKAAKKEEAALLRKELRKLEEDAKTPEVRLAEMKAKLAELEA